jgi:hypothetical protein
MRSVEYTLTWPKVDENKGTELTGSQLQPLNKLNTNFQWQL